MPQVENLSQGFTPPVVQSNPPAFTPNQQTPNGNVPANSVQPVQQQSSNLAIPSIFGGMQLANTKDEVIQSQPQTTSYVFYINDAKQGWNIGDWGLSLNGQTFKKEPLKYFVGAYASYVTSMNQNGDITFATKDMSKREGTKGEHYHCLIFVFHEDRLVPAKAEFRTTKANAATKVIEEIKQSGDTNWINKSDAHRIAAQCQIDWGRVVATTVSGPRKTGPNGDYNAAITQCKPATLDEMKLLFDEGNKADFQELFQIVKQEWEDRKQFLDSKCSGR